MTPVISMFESPATSTGLKKIGVLTQLLDRVAAVAQNRMLAVDIRNLRLALGSGQESGVKRHPAVIAQLGNNNAIRPRTRLHHRQVELARIDIKLCRRHARAFLFMNRLFEHQHL